MIPLQLPRGGGKTYILVAWVMQGQRIDTYPHWNRIIITHSIDAANYIRKAYKLEYTQVFTIHEWATAHRGTAPVEVCIDNADAILHRMVGPSKIVMATFDKYPLLVDIGEKPHVEQARLPSGWTIPHT